MAKMQKVFHWGKDVAQVKREWEGYYTCRVFKNSEWHYYDGNTPAQAAEKAGFTKYCLDHEHKCEGPKCTTQTHYKYCASCHFDNRQPEDPTLGILGI